MSPMRTASLRLSLTAALVCAAGVAAFEAPAVRAETVAEKPRLTVSLAGSPEFTAALKTSLAATKRFVIVDKPSLKNTLSAASISLSPAITVQQSRRARALAGTDLVLEGTLKSGPSVQVTTRLFDLRNGEFSRDLSLFGEAGSTKALAGQLATYVRRSVPLRCLIRTMAEDVAILDLGEADGVTVGSFFKVYRHPANTQPVEIGLLRVTQLEAFGARAEVEETKAGQTVGMGDTLVEQTSELNLPE